MAYARGETDEFIRPTILFDENQAKKYLVSDGDCIICFNFRADRVRQITRSFTESGFSEFERKVSPKVYYLCMTEYFPNQTIPVLFPPISYTNILGEIISQNGLRQFRVAETEKYAHITYFLNLGREKPFEGEERILVPSQKVATYDLTPLMSAPFITRELLNAINKGDFPVYIANYANPDMVGHTGNLEATIEALRYIDYILGVLVKTVLSKNGTVIITADHGNCEQMTYSDGSPNTAHTTNPVPFILVNASNLKNVKLKSNMGLSSVAPTILDILNIPKPPEMLMSSLIL
jgi:2,3-bisphosphoglycerate-independent phosphoglycerate mutase